MSRTQAEKRFQGERIVKDLKEKSNIIIKAHSMSGTASEAPGAYKDVDEVTRSVEKAGISKRVIRAVPMVTVKG